MHYMTIENCRDHVGEVFHSSWMPITQERIDAFGAATDDPDPHHIDPEWAAAHGPWGKTIAFGWQTAALTTPMLYEVFRYALDGDPVSYGYPAFYGLNRLRFIAPVLCGARIRGRIEDKGPRRTLHTFEITVEIEGGERPALVGEVLMMWLEDSAGENAEP